MAPSVVAGDLDVTGRGGWRVEPGAEHGQGPPRERRATPRELPTPVVETWVAPQAPEPSVRRRWPWVVTTSVALVGVVVSSAIAVQQRGVAAEWRERAVAAQAELDEATEVAEQLDRQVDRTVELLDASETDVRDLEDRLRTLADEKAQAEDDATVLDVESEVVIGLVERLAEASRDLDTCVTELVDLQEGSVAAFNASTTGAPIDTDALNERAAEVTVGCTEARSSAAAASAAADQLLER